MQGMAPSSGQGQAGTRGVSQVGRKAGQWDHRSRGSERAWVRCTDPEGPGVPAPAIPAPAFVGGPAISGVGMIPSCRWVNRLRGILAGGNTGLAEVGPTGRSWVPQHPAAGDSHRAEPDVPMVLTAPQRPQLTSLQHWQAQRPPGPAWRPPAKPKGYPSTQPKACSSTGHPAGDRLERKGQLWPGL